MKKSSIFALASILLTSPLLTASANAADDARIYYDKGIKIEAPAQAFDVKINTWVGAEYTYQANENAPDTSGFDVTRARVIFTGNVLEKEFSYQLEADFVGSTDDGSAGSKKSTSLKNAYVSWNPSDLAKIRIGQWKTPFTRQYPLADYMMMFPRLSIATDEFKLGRNVGLGVYGNGDGWEYGSGVFNGNSDGEGENYGPKDTKMEGIGYVALTNNYKRNTTESDLDMTNGVGWTAGTSVAYQQADNATTVDEVSITDEGDYFYLSGDLGMKSNGLALQGEFFYRRSDLDQTDIKSDDIGYYLQGGYFLIPKDIELAARFSTVNYDAKDKDVHEYSIFINKYFMGNNLKLETGVAFIDNSPATGDDTLNTRYEMYVSGYF